MARWQQIVDEAPEFASSVQAVFDAYLHKTLATLRRDGSPRISAIEATFLEGDLWLGMMTDSLKARDLLRDPRMALHCATVDTTLATGDAKVSGRAVAVDDPQTMLALAHGNEEIATGAHLFRVDVDEVVLTRVVGEDLVVDSWHEGRGVTTVRRK
jgi:hypothetical protein